MDRASWTRVVQACGLFLTLALASEAVAQPAKSRTWSSAAYSPALDPDDPAPNAQALASGARNHDGLYLRLQLGLAYTSMWCSFDGTNWSIRGAGTGFEIALGAALNRHVIVYGTLIDSTARDPDGGFSGQSPTGAAHGRITSMVFGGHGAAGVVAGGPGVAYYLDSNLFFAGSLLGSLLLVQDTGGGFGARSQLGFTFEGKVGQEWWVSDNWGLGVSGRMLLGMMKDHPHANESVPTWKLAAFSLLFSATYN